MVRQAHACPHPAGGSDWMPISGITMYDEWEERWSWYGNMMHPSDHEYRVRAVDNGAYSDWVYLSVDGAPSYDLPGRPSGLAASSVTSSSFTVSWQPVEDAMYQVALVEPLSMRHPYSIAWSTGTVQYVYSEPWQATFSGLQAGRTYQVVVMSISTWHGSFYANESAMLEVRTAPSPAGAPAAPGDLQVRPKDDLSGIELRWLDNSSDETGFTIARTGGGTAYFYPSANQISYLDTTAQPGVSYTYWVLARNAYGNSSWSNSANTTIVLPTVSIEADISPVAETTGDYGQLMITRDLGSQALRHALEVSYSPEGTAEPGTDYQALSGVLLIPAGHYSATIPIKPITDANLETDESVEAVLNDQPARYVLGDWEESRAAVIITGINGFHDGGNSGNRVIHWVDPAAGGGMGNQGVGTVQQEVPPQIQTGMGGDGLAWARVRVCTGLVLVYRSYSGVQQGDQGVGTPGSDFPGLRVYVTPQLSSDLNAHEAGHVTATGKVYEQTMRWTDDWAAQYRAGALIGNPGESESSVAQRLERLIDWDASLAAFKELDEDVNKLDGDFHAWETAQGGGPFAWNQQQGGTIDGIEYDRILRSREETEPGYNLPDYDSYTPPP